MTGSGELPHFLANFYSSDKALSTEPSFLLLWAPALSSSTSLSCHLGTHRATHVDMLLTVYATE